MSSEYQSYMAAYCEWCGTLHDSKGRVDGESLSGVLEMPVARVDVLEAIAYLAPEDIDAMQVGETVAIELGTCAECGDGEVVKRYYTTGDVPEPEFEPDESEFIGRDPKQDALLIDEVGGFGEEGAAHDLNDLAGGHDE